MFKRVVVMVAAVALPMLILAGCGGPPKEDIEKATKAKASADAAKADVYSKDAYDAAMAAWKEGQDLDKKSDFGKSKVKYQEAAKKFDEAGKAAPDGMKAMQDANMKMMADMKSAMEMHAKDKGTKAAMMKMKKDDKMKYEAMGKEIDGMMKEAEGMNATDPSGAKDKLDAANKQMDDMKSMTMMKKK